MKTKLSIIALSTYVLLVTACAPAPGETPAPVETLIIPNTNGTAEAVTESASKEVATVAQVPTQNQPVAETPEVNTTPGATVILNEQGGLAPFLSDGRGRSLYAYMNDSQNSGTSACVDDCAIEWPPLLTAGRSNAGKGVDATLLGTLKRDDGSTQVTYNGWPLYYYDMDTIPGTTNGQSYNGVWFLVSPTGKPIQQ